MTRQLTIADLTGDFVLYRDLKPGAAGLPGLAELRDELGLAPDALPRKRDADYARVIRAIIARAEALRGRPAPEAFLTIGDTDNDRRVAEHLAAVSGLPSLAFIGVDRLDEPERMVWEGGVALANRWGLLGAWLAELDRRGVAIARAALLLDIDKTLLGPRGRCDAVIDEARTEGALQVARTVLGAALDEAAFRSTYATLCRKEYHSLTLDNQDYVVFIALVIAGGALSLEALRAGLADGTTGDFRALLAAVAGRIPPALAPIAAEVRRADEMGDPTPFKTFRRAEFAATVARMAAGQLTLCHEVVEVTRTLEARGALCVAASDKPAEASYPSPEQAAAGLLPLHRTPATMG